MMLVLGMFVFQLQTLPYQNMKRDVDYRWPPNSRVGQRPAMQFLGVNEEKIVLSGSLMPEITGGRLSLLALNMMADEGRAWPLLGGNGTIYGMFVINSVSETYTEFFGDGTARKIDFTATLTRVDESLTSMFGDIQKQAESLVGNAGAMAGKMQSTLGGLLS